MGCAPTVGEYLAALQARFEQARFELEYELDIEASAEYELQACLFDCMLNAGACQPGLEVCDGSVCHGGRGFASLACSVLRVEQCGGIGRRRQ